MSRTLLPGDAVLDMDEPALIRRIAGRKGVRAATKEVADAVAADAALHAPRLTGALADSIAVVPDDIGWQVIVGVDYAAYVEFGTRFMHAEPYLRPAVNKYREQPGTPG